MNRHSALAIWKSVRTLRRAFREQQAIVAEVRQRAEAVIRTPAGTPEEFAVDVGPLPEALLTWRRNLFSVLFQSVYHVLDLDPAKRMLYGKINQLFRIWVTSADNLLDAEDKESLPIRMPGESRVMRQVVAVMAADRVLAGLLNEAVRDGLLTAGERDILSAASLQLLLPSAAQEASEEGGIVSRPSPDYVLGTIHRLKTGLLFHLPFLGPERIERNRDPRKVEALKESLMAFALGCQILDDIRDMAQDHRERRHNYILSCLQWSGDPFAQKLDERRPEPGDRIYLEVPQVTGPAARLAMAQLRSGLDGMSREGLSIQPAALEPLANSIFGVLDLGDLCHAG
jgi:hypothetical protein